MALGNVKLPSSSTVESTDWIVLAVGPAGTTRLVSFRDGAKLGFGKRTARIYRTIRETLRLARAGPYDVPDGFETYDTLADQFTLAVPRGWTPFHQTSVEVGGVPLWGRTIFSERALVSSPEGADELDLALRRIEAGTQSAITLDRREALAGMKCDGFSKSDERKLVAWVEQDPLLAAAREILEGPVVEPLPLGDCIGRRLRARVRDTGGAEILLEASGAGSTGKLPGGLALEPGVYVVAPPGRTETARFVVTID